MSPFEASVLFRCLSVHFTKNKYDFRKYNGHITGNSLYSENKFNQSQEKLLYSKLSVHENPELLVVANLIKQPKSFITDVMGQKGLDIYKKYVDFSAALYYNFSQELEFFEHPKMFKAM